MTPKQRYFKKKLNEAPMISCACGCGQEIKAVDNYARPRIFINGHNTPIKYDNSTQHKREWNHRNRKHRNEWKMQTFRKRKQQLIALFNSCCARCTLAYDGTNAAVFHFHHLRDKSFSLGNQLMNKAWAIILEEASKCEMICANCHELEHSSAF